MQSTMQVLKMKSVDNSLKTNWKYIAIVVVFAVLIGGGTLWYVRLFDQQISQLETSNVTLQIPKEKKSEIDTSDFTLSEVEGWQTYRSDEFGFEVRYPGTKSSPRSNSPICNICHAEFILASRILKK